MRIKKLVSSIYDTGIELLYKYEGFLRPSFPLGMSGQASPNSHCFLFCEEEHLFPFVVSFFISTSI